MAALDTSLPVFNDIVAGTWLVNLLCYKLEE